MPLYMGDIEVAVPDGLEPGNPFLVQLAGGQQVQIIVPPGCYAGAVLSVQLPELAELLPPAPVAVEMPEGTLVPGASLVEASPADAHAPLVPMPSVEERLELMRAPSSSSGFHGVTKQSSGGKQFLAQIRVDGKQRKLGRFETVEEAAMAYAVAMGPADVARLRDLSSRHDTSISPEAALAQAAQETLTLLLAPGTKTGYRGVGLQSKSSARPYTAIIHREGKSQLLGCFATAEEAALCYARAAAEKPLPTPREATALGRGATAEEAMQAAHAAGLTLQLSSNSKAGYRGVTISKKARSRPFRAENRTRKLGGYASAEGAALAVARAEAVHRANPCGTGRKCTCVLPWLQADYGVEAENEAVELEAAPAAVDQDVVEEQEGHSGSRGGGAGAGGEAQAVAGGS